MTPEQRARARAFLARPALERVLMALNGDGEETRVVGGAVRDLLLDAPVGDVDLATTALPAETIRRGEMAGFKVVPTGIEHGTVTLLRDRATFEVTTLRRDIETDGRHARVAFGRDFAADARRRDFTINAMSLDRQGALFDVCGGLSDLAARRIRFIGDPALRIAEDYLRILRFFRFQARYGQGPLDPGGLSACIAGRAGLERLSRERVRAEMLKLLVAPGAVAAIEAMAGLLMPVLGCVPRLSRFAAVVGWGDTSALILRSRVSGISKDAQELAGAFFETQASPAPQDEGRGLEPAGTMHPALLLAALCVAVHEDAVRLRDRLRLSNDEFDRIERLAMAMEALSGQVTAPVIASLRRLAHRTGADAAAGGLVLLTARAEESRQIETRALIAELGRTPPFLPTGRDVIALGVAAGPNVGLVLEQARADWIEAGCPASKTNQAAFVAQAILRLTAT